ncbi:MAG: hypothetical protein OXF20_00005, partial [Gammaproteobacteria bacterium]|nr:hypothetical protein [Gammaproteobacteria bacterium]
MRVSAMDCTPPIVARRKLISGSVCAHPGAAIRTAASTASAVNLGAYIHKLTNWKMTALQPT